jgi:hypothetical protein
MKNLWIALLFLLTVSACLPDKIGKKDDPEPDLSGTYQVTEVQVTEISNGNRTQFVPPTISGTINVTKVDNSNVNVSINVTGALTLRESGPIVVQKASGKTYDMYENNTRIGTIDGTEFRFDVSTTDGRVVIVARK